MIVHVRSRPRNQARGRGAPPPRKGAVIPFAALMLVLLISMVAIAVDLGYVVHTRRQLASAADAAALAGAARLLQREALRGQPLDPAPVRSEAVRFARLNSAGGVRLALDENASNSLAGEIVCGHIANPSDFLSPLRNDNPAFNSVQVRVQRTKVRNGPLELFFSPILGTKSVELEARATATYEGGITGFRVDSNAVTAPLLPFALEVDSWNAIFGPSAPDEYSYNPVTRVVTAGSDGIREATLFPAKGTAPGNFGTVDIGKANNSTADVSRQILHGVNKSDLDAIGGSIAIPPGGVLNLQGDTGISAGFKDELAAIVGQPRVIPIYRAPVVGNGNNAVFPVVAWAGIIITHVKLTGMTKEIVIQPEYVVTATAIGGGGNSNFVVRPLRLTR